MTKIIGFDCSSSTVGWGTIEFDDKFNILSTDCGYFKPQEDGSIFDRLDHVRSKINEILNINNPDEIFIEDIVKFMKNKSSAQTIITLSVFNRAIGMTAFDFKNKTSPTLLSVMTIRHKIKEGKTIPKKHDVPERLEKILNIKFPFVYNKKNKIMEESYDAADGLAVATAAFIIKKTPVKVKKVSKKNLK